MSTETKERSEHRPESFDEKTERVIEKIDFKMVTFDLAGKEYGIDIMNVKEIAKASKFTYVPNAAPFVRGVHNLRGEIISIIDLRTLFHLPAERKTDDSLESLLILRVEDRIFGVIVDSIDKVVGISSGNIQPPHPIFGDINIKYIKGIVENQSKLYIILDVEKIFAPKAAAEKTARREDEISRTYQPQPSYEKTQEAQDDTEIAENFIKETLSSLRNFWVTKINISWFKQRYSEWKNERKAEDIQLKDPSDAEKFLENFFSPFTGRLWDEDYAKRFSGALPDLSSKTLNVWNIGCGKGSETYSLAVILKKRYPDSRIKIWANDSDLLNISMAPNIVFDPVDIPPYYRNSMVEARGGLSFSQDIRDSIFFEFHDVINPNPLPPLDLIVCRDMLSFLQPTDQIKIIADFSEKLKNDGAILMGFNERLDTVEGWKRAGDDSFTVFVKNA